MRSPELSRRPKKSLKETVKSVGAALGLMAATSGAAFGQEARRSGDNTDRTAVTSTEKGVEELSADARVIFDDKKALQERYAAVIKAINNEGNGKVIIFSNVDGHRVEFSSSPSTGRRIIHTTVDNGARFTMSQTDDRSWDALPNFSADQLRASVVDSAPAAASTVATPSTEPAPEKPAFTSEAEAREALFTARYPEEKQMAAVEYLLKQNDVKKVLVGIVRTGDYAVELLREGTGEGARYSYALLIGEETVKFKSGTTETEAATGYTSLTGDNTKVGFDAIAQFQKLGVEKAGEQNKAEVAAGLEQIQTSDKKWNEKFNDDSARSIEDAKAVVAFVHDAERSPQNRYEALRLFVEAGDKDIREFWYGVSEDGRPVTLKLKIDKKTTQLKFEVTSMLSDGKVVDRVMMIQEGVLTPDTLDQIDLKKILR